MGRFEQESEKRERLAKFETLKRIANERGVRDIQVSGNEKWFVATSLINTNFQYSSHEKPNEVLRFVPSYEALQRLVGKFREGNGKIVAVTDEGEIVIGRGGLRSELEKAGYTPEEEPDATLDFFLRDDIYPSQAQVQSRLAQAMKDKK